MKSIALLAVIFLAGCESAPKTVFVPTEVKVPVREACKISPPPVPDWFVDQLPKDASRFDKAKAVLAELEQRRAYEAELRAAATKCE